MKRLASALRVLAIFSLLAVAVPNSAIAQDAPLYERVGGQSGIEALVDQVLANVGADTRINGFFANADMVRTRLLLVELLCQKTGGPCVYSGRALTDAHRGLGITDAHFEALVEDLVAALDALSVSDDLKTELLNLFGSFKSDVVEGQAPPPSNPAPQPAPSSPSPGTFAVQIQGFAFSPSAIKVTVGSTVTWTNTDPTQHTATGQAFNTGPIPSGGGTASATFSTPGTFSYQCNFHSSMRGEIIVVQ